MCGITGFIGSESEQVLKKMTDSLIHRGPDNSGYFFDNGVALGHRRLSIIDLTPTGHQPMFSKDKKTVIVFNGEIYNFKELKENMIKDGVSFSGHSDTEVIIALYKKFGEECFKKMNGMFAIAIYDFENKKLVLSRDRLGKKPLYWGIFENTLVFASELKAIILHPKVKKEIDPISLELYLYLDYVPTPRSIFKNIYKLEPGSYLIYKNEEVIKQSFWNLDFREKGISFDEALFGLDKKINESVKKRLISDVPLGVFLSGGLDSSTITYYAKKNTKDPLHTFSVGFSEKSFDESRYAEEVSKFLGTKHHHTNLSSKDSLEIIPEIMETIDEPMADASIIPTYLLSKFTKEHVTVVLGGDGGDELFAGYPTFQADIILSFYTLLPFFVKKIISQIVNIIPVSDTNFSFGFKLKKFIEGVDDDVYKTHQNWLGTFDEHSISKLLRVRNTKSIDSWLGFVMNIVGLNNGKNSLLGMYMRTYMMDEVLVKVDRASMKASLETRSPFLDYELVDFINSLPYKMKQKGFKGKYILKKLMLDKLPKRIVNRSKKGFGIPMSEWLKGDLKDLCLTLLSKENLDKHGLFDSDIVNSLIKDHLLGRRNNRKKIWNLMVFQMWYNQYFVK